MSFQSMKLYDKSEIELGMLKSSFSADNDYATDTLIEIVYITLKKLCSYVLKGKKPNPMLINQHL